ncbi:MAG TPA: VWA domain-containing protein, partial [Blastocatellia bacterium]|nr:VWA domain-containing protein [Blastocatellia bacterium]
MSCYSRFRSIGIQLIALLLCLNSPLSLLAQQPAPPPKPAQQPAQTPPGQSQDPAQDPDSVVRINTQLVQIDAVVTDGKGNHVDTLTEDDFELFVDGKKQALTYFRLVKLAEAKTPEPTSGKGNAKDSLPPAGMPTRSLAPEEVKRTIAFVVDDLGLSFQSTYFAREAIKKFVREQMQEGDLVGIIRTGRGAGALQQFTSDKRVLYAAIEKLSWNPYSRDMMPNFGGNDPNDQRSQEAREAEARFEDFRETVFSVGTLGALNFVVRGLRELPGRKM